MSKASRMQSVKAPLANLGSSAATSTSAPCSVATAHGYSARRVLAVQRPSPQLEACLESQALLCRQQRAVHRVVCAAGDAEVSTVDPGASLASQDQEEEGGAHGPSPMDYGYCSAQGVRDTMEDEVSVHYNADGKYL